MRINIIGTKHVKLLMIYKNIRIWEHPEIKISDLYAFCINTMFVTSFYSIIIPSCILWGMATLIFVYYIDKFLLLRRRTSKYFLGKELGCEMVHKNIKKIDRTIRIYFTLLFLI